MYRSFLLQLPDNTHPRAMERPKSLQPTRKVEEIYQCLFFDQICYLGEFNQGIQIDPREKLFVPRLHGQPSCQILFKVDVLVDKETMVVFSNLMKICGLANVFLNHTVIVSKITLLLLLFLQVFIFLRGETVCQVRWNIMGGMVFVCFQPFHQF